MEGRVDFPLERGRLLAPALPSGTLGPLGPAYADNSTLGRPTVSDITRTGTPSTLSALGHYANRYMPPSMSVHSQGASFALMGGYLSGTGHAPEGLKSLMPEMPQFWGPTHTDGYHRYVINNNMYPPYPFQIGAESLPLLPSGVGGTSGPAQQSSFTHRIYELHKDPYLANTGAAVSQAGGYFSLQGNTVSLPSRPSSPQPQPGIVTFKQESKYEPIVTTERPSKHEKRSHSTKHEGGKSECKHGRESDRKERGDGETKSETKDSHKSEKGRSKKGESVDSVWKKSKVHEVHEVHEHERQKDVGGEEKMSDKTSSKHCIGPTPISGNVKTQSITTLPTVTVTASGTTASHSTSACTGSTQSVFTCVQPVTVATTQGSQMTSINSVKAQGKTASALPYYHNMYSHPHGNSPPVQGPRKVYATTFVPEVGTVNGPLDKSLPKLCETRVKSEIVRTSCCREKHSSLSCPPSSDQHTDRNSDPPSKHSSRASKCRTSGDTNSRSCDDRQNPSPVSSTGESCVVRAGSDAAGVSNYDDRGSGRTTSGKTEHACEPEALDYTTTQTSRVCARHQVKSSPSKSVCPTNATTRSDQKVSAHVQPTGLGKSHEFPPIHVSSSSPDTKPDSTTPQDQSENQTGAAKQEKTISKDSAETNAALNLTKAKKSSKASDASQKSKDKPLDVRKTEVPVERGKRCGSAPPQTIISSSQEEVEIDPGTEQTDGHTERVEENLEHTGGNIPVGIAVARQRAEQPRGQDPHGARTQAPPPDAPPRGLGEEDSSARQYSQDREEFLRQQKAILSGQAKVTVNTGLPPNLVVTGSVAGNDTGLQDDLRVRPLASQWVAAGHSVNPNPWLSQNPFALHPAITTTSTSTLDPNPFPITAPSGFKIAQDSFTGNLFLIPADYVEQGGGLWPFPATHGSQPPPTHFQHLLQTSPVPHLAQMPPLGSPQLHEDHDTETPDHTPGSRQSPDIGDQRDDSDRGSQGQCGSRSSSPGSRPTSGSGKEKTPTPQSPPGTPGSPQDREKPMNLPNQYIPDMAVAAQQYTYPYPTGHLPYMFNPGLIPVQGMPVNLSEPLTVKTEPPSVQSRGTSPMVLTPPPSDETTKVEPTFKEAAVYADFPKPVTKCCASVQTCDFGPPAPSRTLKEQCSQTCHELDLSKTETLLKAAEKLSKLSDCASQSEPENRAPSPVTTPKTDPSSSSSSATKATADYNPFTDPLILKAADGLELLSALAERRAKCSSPSQTPSVPASTTSSPVLASTSSSTSTSTTTSTSTSTTSILSSPTSGITSPSNIHNILPSPSDSFKSDNFTAEETSSVDADRSGDVTPKRDVKRGIMSPKWTFPKKDTNPSVLTIGGIKIPTDLQSFLDTGLDSMDAMEVEMRMRLAELQRRYKEKQRELAKLQPKVKDGSKERRESRDSKEFVQDAANTSDDKNSAKRKPGRPRKRKFFTKKKDEDSPSKTACKESHTKKKRLPEELVDRVFRKLPPVKSDKLKSMRTKSGFFLKRRSSTSSGRSTADTSSCSNESFLSKSDSFGDKKFFRSKGANIAKGKFKPFAKRKDEAINIGGERESSQSTSDAGNLFSNIENSLAEKKRPKTMLKGIERQHSSESAEIESTSPAAVSPSMLESGLGLLAKFATSALTAANMKKKKRKLEEGVFVEKEADDTRQGPLNKRASDTEAGDPQCTNKKRKPGRPKKCAPISSGGGTETIVAKKSKTLGLLQLREVGQSSKDKKPTSKQEHRQINLDGSTTLKPLYLDEEWCLRRSERIFLSEPSPQPSPNNQQPGAKQDKTFFTPRPSKTQNDRDRAKVQKAKSLQELSQKVKRKYTKNMNKKTNFSEDRFNRGSMKARPKETRDLVESASDQDSGSDGDDIPLSALRRRPDTPEPRSCVMRLDDLKDGLRVLEFQDGLFYEGALKAINPPDIYGVVVDNQRGNRPHIYPQEEILKNVIVDVKPGSPRFLPEGTRVCAYWSQQFSCLYPGTVAKTSPNPHADKYSVNVEFDDGDSGRIPLDHIRLLPQDFPLVSYDPNPLLNLSKRRRRTTSDDSEFRKSSEGYFSLSECKKRPSKRDSFSGQFDGALEEDSEDPDVFESDVRKKSQSRDHSPRSNLHDVGQKAANILNRDGLAPGKSTFGKSFQNKDSLGLATLSPRREELKPSSILRPSAFDMKKLGLQYGGGSGQDEEDSSSDEDVDSSDEEECILASGAQESDSDSPDEDTNVTGEGSKKVGKKAASKNIAQRKKRSEKATSVSSQSKGGLAAFLPARQLWKWSGKSTKRPGLKGKAKKEFYKAILRGKEHINVGDCAVFLSTGRPNLPFIGRIESMWEAWGGQMTVKVKWFYHPEETKGGKKLADPRGALFESPHEDENDVQTISHKCDVQSVLEFKRRRADALKKGPSLDDVTNLYYLAGYYDPTIGLVRYEADVL